MVGKHSTMPSYFPGSPSYDRGKTHRIWNNQIVTVSECCSCLGLAELLHLGDLIFSIPMTTLTSPQA